MNRTEKFPRDFPAAIIKKRAKLTLIWLVPFVAAIVAGWLVWANVQKIGPVITIEFEDGNGLQANQTVLKYHGVRIGNLRSVELTKDSRHVEVQARLERAAANLAREGALFWIVRPQVGAGGLHGLETIVSGPYIQVQPENENGAKQKKFIGLEEAPAIQPPGGGKEFILLTPAIRSLAGGSPVYYRGLEVGSVLYVGLNPDSTAVAVHILIKNKFAPLVRTNSVFWNAGGIDVTLHLRGIDVSAENAKSLVIGGIAFATPDNPAVLAAAGAIFPLNNKEEAKWLEWSPAIAITNANVISGSSAAPLNLNEIDQSQ